MTKLTFIIFGLFLWVQSSSAVVVQNADLSYMGVLVSATARDASYYSGFGSVIEDNDNYHSFACSSSKPYMPSEDPFIFNQFGSFYGIDEIRYDRINKSTLKALNTNSEWLGANLTAQKTRNPIQSPCTSGTTFFNGYYYSFFESFTEGSRYGGLVSVFAARSKGLGEEPEILTQSGWKRKRNLTETWKPVFLPAIAEEPISDQNLALIRSKTITSSPGNDLWGVGVPAAIVKDGKIYLMMWDNTSGGGKVTIATSSDGINFTRRNDLTIPYGGDLKIIRDPSSVYDGYFAVFSTDFDDAKERFQVSVGFSKDLKTWSPKFPLASFPIRIPKSNPGYKNIGGALTFRVAGNSIGEISPFSKGILLRVPLFRTKSTYNDNIFAQVDLYAYQMKLRSTLSGATSPIAMPDPAQPVVVKPVPTISRSYITQGTSAQGLYACGSGFSTTATASMSWSYQGNTVGDPSRYTSTNSNPAYKLTHYLEVNPNSSSWDIQSCVYLPLSNKMISDMGNGWSATARIYQPSIDTYSNPVQVGLPNSRKLASCNFNGKTISSGESVLAYSVASVTSPATCASASQTRTCTNGILSGSYSFESCSVVSQPLSIKISMPTSNVSDLPTIQWSATGDTPNFIVDISPDPAFSYFWNHSTPGPARSINYSIGGWGKVNTQTAAPARLISGKVYYVRVAAFDANWKWLMTSAPVSFQVMSASCSFNGKTISSGQSVLAYSVASVTSPATCASASQTRTCTNGTLSGSYSFESCSVVTPAPTVVDHNNAGSIASSVLNADGTVTVSGFACAKNLPNSIAVDLYFGGPYGSGKVYGRFQANGYSGAAYQSACQSTGKNYSFSIRIDQATVKAQAGKAIYIHGINPFNGINGVMNTLLSNSGNLKIPSAPAPALAPASCSFNGKTISSGQSVLAYSVASVTSPATCASASQTRICTNGTLTGSYSFGSCSVVTQPLSIKVSMPTSNVPDLPTIQWSASGVTPNFIVDISPAPAFSYFWNHSTPGTARSINYSIGRWGKVNTQTAAPARLISGKVYYVRVAAFDANWKWLMTSAPVSFKVK